MARPAAPRFKINGCAREFVINDGMSLVVAWLDSNADSTFRPFDAVYSVDSTGTGLCNDTFTLIYDNSSEEHSRDSSIN